MLSRWSWAQAAALLLVWQSSIAGCESTAKRTRLAFDLHYNAPEEAPAPMAERRLQQREGRRLGKKDSHPVDLVNYDNVQYHLEIKVGQNCDGTGGFQSFSVVPDSGSSAVWFPGRNCTRCKGRTAKFDITKSCSAHMFGQRTTFRYGDGTVAIGGTFQDTVRIGDLVVRGQILIQVDEMESETHMKSDGILGLAHHYASDRDDGKGRTFMASLFREHPEMPQQFSFFLTGNTDKRSQLVFGDPDLASHSKESEFHYGNGYYLSHTKLWLTSVYSLGWSDTGVEYSFPEKGIIGSAALVDSGSSLIVLSPPIYDHLVKELKWRFTGCRELKEQQILTCDCPPANDLSRTPSLVINMIDESHEQFALCMSPDEYILESTDPLTGRSTCVPALQRGSATQPVPIIFGMALMRSFVVTFDPGNDRIGFARSIMSPLPAYAVCKIDSQPFLRRTIWVISLLMAMFSVVFACYVLFAPKGVCSRPSWFRWSREGGALLNADNRDDAPL